MSTEEQEKLIGRLFLEHRELKQQAGIVDARLRQVGQSLLTISQQLKEGQFETAALNLKLFRSDVVDLSAVDVLVTEYRAAKERMDQCASALANLK